MQKGVGKYQPQKLTSLISVHLIYDATYCISRVYTVRKEVPVIGREHLESGEPASWCHEWFDMIHTAVIRWEIVKKLVTLTANIILYSNMNF